MAGVISSVVGLSGFIHSTHLSSLQTLVRKRFTLSHVLSFFLLKGKELTIIWLDLRKTKLYWGFYEMTHRSNHSTKWNKATGEWGARSDPVTFLDFGKCRLIRSYHFIYKLFITDRGSEIHLNDFKKMSEGSSLFSEMILDKDQTLCFAFRHNIYS